MYEHAYAYVCTCVYHMSVYVRFVCVHIHVQYKNGCTNICALVARTRIRYLHRTYKCLCMRTVHTCIHAWMSVKKLFTMKRQERTLERLVEFSWSMEESYFIIRNYTIAYIFLFQNISKVDYREQAYTTLNRIIFGIFCSIYRELGALTIKSFGNTMRNNSIFRVIHVADFKKSTKVACLWYPRLRKRYTQTQHC